MKKTILIACFFLSACSLFSQIAPPPARLKYFGYALVDCGVDDPNDASTITNYIHEVDSFSNVAHMSVNTPQDTIINRVTTMNNLCIKPILATSSIFVRYANTNGPSGANYDLYPNYQARWDSFYQANASILTAQHIEVIYICDEPAWNGVDSTELNIMSQVIRADCPNIPQMFIEAYTMVSKTIIPTTVDWLGFDHYGIADVSTDPNFLAWLDTLEGRRTRPDQKMWLVFDEEWNSSYWPGGWQPDTMEQVMMHYYDLALADTNIIGLAGFTWPGLASGWLGARSLPQHVIDKGAQLGKIMKAHYNMCTTGMVDNINTKEITVYPNPSAGELNVRIPDNEEIVYFKMYNELGVSVKEIHFTDRAHFSTRDISTGIYFYRVTNEKGTILDSGKLVKE